MDDLVLSPYEGEPNAAECFVHKYLVHVLVVLLHACFSVFGPIPFLLAAIFSPGRPYMGSTTVLADQNICKCFYLLVLIEGVYIETVFCCYKCCDTWNFSTARLVV